MIWTCETGRCAGTEDNTHHDHDGRCISRRTRNALPKHVRVCFHLR